MDGTFAFVTKAHCWEKKRNMRKQRTKSNWNLFSFFSRHAFSLYFSVMHIALLVLQGKKKKILHCIYRLVRNARQQRCGTRGCIYCMSKDSRKKNFQSRCRAFTGPRFRFLHFFGSRCSVYSTVYCVSLVVPFGVQTIDELSFVPLPFGGVNDAIALK